MLFSLFDQPAQTLNYMIAGYAVIFSFMLIYLASLIVRWRNARQDLQTLEDLEARERKENP
jgi:TRAP-type C4-dicarboxylate transport system permease small subunit